MIWHKVCFVKQKNMLLDYEWSMLFLFKGFYLNGEHLSAHDDVFIGISFTHPHTHIRRHTSTHTDGHLNFLTYPIFSSYHKHVNDIMDNHYSTDLQRMIFQGTQLDWLWGNGVGRRPKNVIQSMSVWINFFLSSIHNWIKFWQISRTVSQRGCSEEVAKNYIAMP
jgi:hypothetical protein